MASNMATKQMLFFLGSAEFGIKPTYLNVIINAALLGHRDVFGCNTLCVGMNTGIRLDYDFIKQLSAMASLS